MCESEVEQDQRDITCCMNSDGLCCTFRCLLYLQMLSALCVCMRAVTATVLHRACEIDQLSLF